MYFTSFSDIYSLCNSFANRNQRTFRPKKSAPSGSKVKSLCYLVTSLSCWLLQEIKTPFGKSRILCSPPIQGGKKLIQTHTHTHLYMYVCIYVFSFTLHCYICTNKRCTWMTLPWFHLYNLIMSFLLSYLYVGCCCMLFRAS